MATQAQHAAAPKGAHKAPKAGSRAAQQAADQAARQKEAEIQAARREELLKLYEKIHYSDRYSDDNFEYRHVILPKPLFKLLPKEYFNADDSGTLRLLADSEWRGIGIQQSLGWEHYEVHAPEPHVLLFRRAREQPQPLKRFARK